MNVKFGTVVMANLVVACVMMQGCKNPDLQKQGGQTGTVQLEPSRRPAAKPAPVKPPAAKPDAAPAKPDAAPAKPAVEPARPQVKPLPPTPPPPPETTTYVVRSGDILSRISRRYNITIKAIKDLNPGLNPDRICVGQKLKLPGKVDIEAAPMPSVKPPAAKPAAAAKPAKASTYKPYAGATKDYEVKHGDTLGHIAVASGISVRALKDLNGLEKDALNVGMVLKIPAEKQVSAKPAPAKPAAGQPAAPVAEKNPAEAAVKPAEQSAAAEQPAEVPAVAEQPAADKAAESIPEAQEVKPGEEEKPAEPKAESPRTHVVGNNEDLVAIAIRYSVSPSTLLDENNLQDASDLKPGMVLKLPAGAKVQ